MKRLISILSLIVCIGCFQSCIKTFDFNWDDGPYWSDFPYMPSPLTVNISADTIYNFPSDSVLLNAWVFGGFGPITHSSWKQLSGPSVCSFTDEYSNYTYATDLSDGVYTFKYTASTDSSETATDSVVVVNKHGVIKIIDGLNYSGDPGCNIPVTNIDSYIPAGHSFDVFMKKTDTSGVVGNWIFITPTPLVNSFGIFYSHTIAANTLNINPIGFDCFFDYAKEFKVALIVH